MGVTDNKTGSIRLKGVYAYPPYFYFLVCPSKMKLNCANVMYSKPCHPNYDCSHAGWQFVCCESGCTGDTQFVCVPGGISFLITYTGITRVKTHKLLRVCKQVVTSLFTSCQQVVNKLCSHCLFLVCCDKFGTSC